MKKGLMAIITIIVSVIMSLFIFPLGQSLNAEEVFGEESNFSLFIDRSTGETYRSPVIAGTVEGYGDYELGQTQVQLKANANIGYNIVGWQINLENGEEHYLEIDNTVTISGISFTNTCEDNNTDGYAEFSVLEISQIAEDYQIEPVYDYIYYNLDVTKMFEWRVNSEFDLSNGYKTDTVGGVTIYYTGEVELNVYKNAVIELGEKFLYFGDVKNIDDTLYKQHTDLTGRSENIPIEAGSFRITENLALNFDFYVGDLSNTESINYDETVNIDLKNVGFNILNEVILIDAELPKTDDGRTKSVNFDINLLDFEQLKNLNSNTFNLNLDYDQLYLVEVLPYVDGKLVENDVEVNNLILKEIASSYAYYIFPNKVHNYGTEYIAKYWAKSAINNGANLFGLTGQKSISRLYNYLTYNYYNLSKVVIDGQDQQFSSSGNSFYLTKDILENTKIILNYSSTEYLVEFKPALLIEGNSTATELTHLGNVAEISLVRGQSKTVTTDNLPNLLGYNFYCFSNSLKSNAWQENNEYTATINKDYPTNLVVYVIYKYEQYTVEINGLNSISATNNGREFYPVNRISISNGNAIWTFSNNGTNNIATFDASFNISQSFTLSVISNAGFTIDGFSLDGVEYPTTYTFTILDLAKIDSTVISLSIIESFIPYNLTYQIKAGNTSTSSADKGIMADITLTIADKSITINQDGIVSSDTGWQENGYWIFDDRQLPVQATIDAELNQIKVFNLHLYDQVTLSAIGRTVEDKKFQFAKFQYGSSVRLSSTQDGDKYSASLPVREDCVITAVYGAPTAIIAFSIKVKDAEGNDITNDIGDITKVMQLSKVVIRENSASGNNYYLKDDGLLVFTDELPATSSYTIFFAKQDVGAGFNFIAFDTDIAGSTVGYTFTTNSLTEGDQTVYKMELSFVQISYHLKVVQEGAGYGGNANDNNDLVSFDGKNFTTITASNHILTFKMVTGYYVGKLQIRLINSSAYENIVWNGQDNDYDSDIFDYNLPFEYLLPNAVQDETNNAIYNITLKVVYNIHTYDIGINFDLVNPKQNEEHNKKVTYDNLKVTLSYEDVEIQQTGKNQIFTGVPFNSNVTLTVSGNPMLGIALFGWADSNKHPFDDCTTVLEVTITNDEIYTYLVEYINYAILLQKVGPEDMPETDKEKMGSPYVEVNGKTANFASIMETITVYANANKMYGYTYGDIYYNSYEQYTDFTNWDEDRLAGKIYYLENGVYKLKLDNDKNGTFYYKSKKVVTDSSVFTDSSFNFLNYQLTSYTDEETGITYDAIVYYVKYNYLDIYLNKNEAMVSNDINKTKIYYLFEDETKPYYRTNRDNTKYFLNNFGLYYINAEGFKQYKVATNTANIVMDNNVAYIVEGEDRFVLDDAYGSFYVDGKDNSIVYNYKENVNYTLNNVGDLTFKLEDFASNIEINITKYNGDEYPYDNGVLNYRDKVEIFITLNTISLDRINILLSNGVKISSIQILNTNYDVQLLEDGRFYFCFNVISMLGSIEDDNTIYLTINYTVQQKTLTLKTNVDDAGFYKNNNGQALDLIINEHVNGFTGGELRLSSYDWVGGDVELTSSNQFLYKSNISYKFSQYSDYFVVTKVRAYIGKTMVADTVEELKKFGVFVNYANNGQVLENGISYRYVNDITLELVIQPKFKFNADKTIDGAYYYYTDYQFEIDEAENNIKSKEQFLTYGSEAGKNLDIEFAPYFNNRIKVSYYLDNEKLLPKDVGVYKVVFGFEQNGDDESYPNWLNQIETEYEIYFEIRPATIEIEYNSSEILKKEYDRTSNFDADIIKNNIVLKINGIDVTEYFTFANTYYARITSSNGDVEVEVSSASEIDVYNITLYRLSLANGYLNLKNFALESSTITIKNIINITKKQLSITGLNVLDKVYDGTNSATLGDSTNVKVNGIIEGDDVNPIYSRINATFASSGVGKDIAVNIDASNMLTGFSVSNYVVKNFGSITATIYPYSKSIELPGYGKVTVYNRRGLTDSNLASLLPIDGNLFVEPIIKDTPTYSKIYSQIANYLTGTNEFVIGYQLKLTKSIDGTDFATALDNRLYIEIPTINKLNNVIYLTENNKSGLLNYTTTNDHVVIDLSQMENVDKLILTQTRVMLKWWQILIVIIILLLIVAIALIIFFIKRHQKLKQYRIHDKI